MLPTQDLERRVRESEQTSQDDSVECLGGQQVQDAQTPYTPVARTEADESCMGEVTPKATCLI